jgi:hypothetical protein
MQGDRRAVKLFYAMREQEVPDIIMQNDISSGANAFAARKQELFSRVHFSLDCPEGGAIFTAFLRGGEIR